MNTEQLRATELFRGRSPRVDPEGLYYMPLHWRYLWRVYRAIYS